jgi:hypothetical protein
MDLCISLLIFDFYLYIYMGAQGEPVWWFTAVGSSSGDACWHDGTVLLELVGPNEPSALLFILVIKYVL